MKPNTRFVLYSVVLVLALTTLANLIAVLVSKSNIGIAMTMTILISVCLFIALFNYETPKTPRQIEAALIRKLKDSWIQSLIDVKRSEIFQDLGLKWIVLEKIETASASTDAKLTDPPSIINAFENSGRSLLIVGKPGSGKTVTLLELAGSLLETAEKDVVQAIPVVFNLSNFKRQSLEKWLVRELKTRYDVAEEIGRGWLLQRRLTLLLDGLDEAAQNEQCEVAIKNFLQQPTRPGIVVTANSAKPGLIGLGRAVEIFLNGADDSEDLDRIAQRLDDAELLEPEFDSTKVINWLHWLAKGSENRRQSQFTIAQIQPSWLEGKPAQWLYTGLSRVAGAFVVMGMGASLLYLSRAILRWVYKNPQAEIPGLFNIEDSLGWWLFVTVVVGGLSIAIVDTIHANYFPKQITGSKHGARNWSNFLSLFSYVVACLLPFFAVASYKVDQTNAVRGATVFAIAYGIVFWFRGRERSLESDTNTADQLVWSRARIPFGLLWGVIGGVFCGIVFAFILKRDADAGLKTHLLVLLTLLGSMVGVIAGGLRRVSIVETTSPTQGIRMSARSTILIWLSVGAPSVLLIWGYAALIMNYPAPALGGGVFYGLVLGLLCAFAYSGFGIVYRLVFRLIIWVRGDAPLIDWVHFLDYAANLGFLRKVGGGYVFSQTSLRNCFACKRSPEKLTLLLKALRVGREALLRSQVSKSVGESGADVCRGN